MQDYLTPLHVAAHCGNVAVAKLLLDSKCQVDACAMVSNSLHCETSDATLWSFSQLILLFLFSDFCVPVVNNF